MLNNDEIGKVGEMQFRVDCAKRSLYPAWPDMDRNGYDCIVDNGNRLIKVQIKTSSSSHKQNGVDVYKIQVKKGKSGKKNYTDSCFDIVAIYLIDEDDWYFIKNSDLKSSCVGIFPHSETSKYFKYKNDWSIFDGKF